MIQKPQGSQGLKTQENTSYQLSEKKREKMKKQNPLSEGSRQSRYNLGSLLSFSSIVMELVGAPPVLLARGGNPLNYLGLGSSTGFISHSTSWPFLNFPRRIAVIGTVSLFPSIISAVNFIIRFLYDNLSHRNYKKGAVFCCEINSRVIGTDCTSLSVRRKTHRELFDRKNKSKPASSGNPG